MLFAADFVRCKILVFGKLQVIAFSCFLVVNNLRVIQACSELHADNVLLLHPVVVNAKRKQTIVGCIKAQIAANQFVFRVIGMAVSPFEINGFTNWIEPIVVVFFVKDFEGVQCSFLNCSGAVGNRWHPDCAPYDNAS